MNAKRMDTIKEQKWQGKLIQTQWIDTDLVDCVHDIHQQHRNLSTTTPKQAHSGMYHYLQEVRK